MANKSDQSIEDALRDYYTGGRRERAFMTVLGIVVIIVLTLVVFYQQAAIHQFSKASDERKAAIVKIENDNNANLKRELALQSQEIECIARFFAQPNRTTLTITDIHQCSFSDSNSTLFGGGTTSSSTGASTVPKVNSSASAVGRSSNSSQSVSNPPQSSGDTGTAPAQSSLIVSPITLPVLCNLDTAVLGCN